MKKRIFYLLTLVLIAAIFTFSACEDTETPPTNAAPEEENSGDQNDTEIGGSENGDNTGNGDTEKDEPDTPDTEEEGGNETEEEKPQEYPPSDPSDPYENDKHWDLP